MSPIAPAVLNLCANNYLGLANHPDLIAASKAALDRWGYGMASVQVHLWHAGHSQAAGGSPEPLPRHR